MTQLVALLDKLLQKSLRPLMRILEIWLLGLEFWGGIQLSAFSVTAVPQFPDMRKNASLS